MNTVKNEDIVKRILSECSGKLLQIYRFNSKYCITLFPNEYKIIDNVIYTDYREKIPIKDIEKVVILL